MADTQAMTATAEADEATVLFTVQDGVARITLNKPKAANAISGDQRDLIIQLLAQVDADPAVRAVLIASNGKHFCSGADLRGMAGAGGGGDVKLPGSVMRTMLNGAQKLVAAVLDCGKPVVAAVQGPAAGLGAHLAFACDIVVAADSAFFQEPFVLRGITVDAGGAYLLPRRIGLQKAKELIFFGDKLPAAEALSLGLVNRVVPEAEFSATVEEMVTRLAAGATTGIMLAKRLLNASLDTDRASAFLAEAMAQEVNSYSSDSKEGVMSFLEKRPSNFKGH